MERRFVVLNGVSECADFILCRTDRLLRGIAEDGHRWRDQEDTGRRWGGDSIEQNHIDERIDYRTLDRQLWGQQASASIELSVVLRKADRLRMLLRLYDVFRASMALHRNALDMSGGRI